MSDLDFGGNRLDIHPRRSGNMEIQLTAVDSAGDPYDLSSATIAANIVSNGTTVQSFTSAVTGAGSNILTLTMLPATTALLTAQRYQWKLVVTVGGIVTPWYSGDVFPADLDDPAESSRSSFSQTVNVGAEGLITVATQIGVDLDVLDARYVNVTGDTMTGALVVLDATADGQALAHSQAGAVLNGLTSNGNINLNSANPVLDISPGGTLRVRYAGDYIQTYSGYSLRLNPSGGAVTVPDATADGQALAHSQDNAVLGTVTTSRHDIASATGNSRLVLNASNSGTDLKKFRAANTGGVLTIAALNDAENSLAGGFTMSGHASGGAVTFTGATTVPVPTATGHALRQGSAATVTTLTATGTLRAEGDLNVVSTGSGPYVLVQGDSTASTAPVNVVLLNTAAPTGFRGMSLGAKNDGVVNLRRVSDAGVANGQTVLAVAADDSDIEFFIPVTVPTPTAVDHAVKVVAWDAATKRYAVAGPGGATLEQGDTGARNISSLLTTGYTATEFVLTRTGNLVELQCRNLDYSSGGTLTIATLPVGFRPRQDYALFTATNQEFHSTTPTVYQGFCNGVTGVVQVSNTVDDVNFLAHWYTDQAWPTSLPGTAA